MSTKLFGWSVPVDFDSLEEYADHTYVTSSNGKKWGCWGRSSGGTKICSGKGDAKKAECLSKPEGLAGIVYGLTGVCHQTANRILRPTRKTVKKAHMYGASWLLYGAYGGTNRALDPAWKAKEVHCKIWDWRPDPVYLEQETERDFYFEAVSTAHSMAAESLRENQASMKEAVETIHRLELEALVMDRLGEELDQKELKSITDARNDMLEELEPALLAMSGLESMGSAAATANKLVNELLASIARSMDSTKFKKLFDVEPGTTVCIANQEIVKGLIE